MCRQKAADAPPVAGRVEQAPKIGAASRSGSPCLPGRPGALYERLPRGPHRLDRGEVLAHQRERIQGALSVAAAEAGYHAVTVTRVTGLAGVSRRSFYELFADKDDCLEGTLAAVSSRWVQGAARACDGCGESIERRVDALAATVSRLAAAEPEAALLVLARTHGTGTAAVRRRLELAGAYTQLLRGPRRGVPAPAVARALVGGMLEIVAEGAGGGCPAGPEGLARQLRGWLRAARDRRAAMLLTASAQARLDALPAAVVRPGPGPLSRRTATPRARLHAAALSLAAGGAEAPCGAEIADAARIPVTCFLDLFRDGAACHRAALAAAAEEALAAAEAAAAAAGDWPLSVRPALEALFAHLAAHPLHLPAIAGGPAAGAQTAGTPLRRVAMLLAGSAGTADLGAGIAGAIWHTASDQARRGRLGLLPLLAAEVAYVALAPALGARRAAEIASCELTAAGVCG